MEIMIKQLNDSAKEAFGKDITVTIARCPSFGNTDMCFIIGGKRRLEVATNFLRLVCSGKISESSVTFMGHTSVSSVVTGLPR